MFGQRADVVVVGGGVVGCSIAYHLAKSGRDVILLERGALASEASSANVSMVGFAAGRPFLSPGFWTSAIRYSLDWFEKLSDELGEDVEYVRTGGLVVAETEGEFEVLSRLVAKKRAAGSNVEILSSGQLRAFEPALSPALAGAAYSPDQAQANTMLTTLAFARAATRLGARVREGVGVQGIDVSGGRVAGVRTTDDGPISARVVVNAAGAWAGRIAEMAGLEFPISPKRGEIMVTERVPRLLTTFVSIAETVIARLNADTLEYEDTSSNPATGSDGHALYRVFYTRQAPTGHVHFGGRGDYVGFHKRPGLEGVASLAADMRRVVPVLRGVNVIRMWAGLMAVTPDGLPVIGPAREVEGFVQAAGLGGSGLLTAPAIGRLVAQLVDGQEPFIPLDAVSPARFSIP